MKSQCLSYGGNVSILILIKITYITYYFITIQYCIKHFFITFVKSTSLHTVDAFSKETTFRELL